MPETSYNPWPENGYFPIGGVNSEDNESFIDDTEVQDARNFLFERNQAIMRPGLTGLAITGMAGLTIKWAASVLVNATYFTFLLTTTNRLFVLTGNSAAATEITPAQAISTIVTDFRPFSVNQETLFPNLVNVAQGFVRWTGSGVATYIFGASNPTYGTSVLTRAVMSPPFGTNSLEWSKAGDETVWNTSPSTDGSGNATLVDIPDSIVGFVVIHNVLVIIRPTGFHLGYNTGIAIPPLRFETFTRNHVGVVQPSAWDADNNVMYFVGPDDAYTFDLQAINPIGTKIRNTLLAQVDAGVVYSGYTTQLTINGRPRLRFHLVPVSGAAAGTPAYSYDIQSGRWSVHSYGKVWNWAFSYRQSLTSQSPAFIDNTSTPTIWYWDSSVACETAGYLVGKSWRTDYRRDMQVNKVMVSGRDFNQATAVTVTVGGSLVKLEGTSKADSQAFTGTNSGKWIRKWFNIRQPIGQDFNVRIDVPANTLFATDYVSCDLSEAGGARNV